MNPAAVGIRGRRAALDAAARGAIRDATWAWAVSRALCWGAGIAAVLAFGAHAGPHDPLGATAPFGSFGDTLVAPAARWDSVWYLLIADHGYVSQRATEFYPVYPLAARALGWVLGSSLVGGIVVSLGSLLAALYLLERLAARELGADNGRRTMLLLAFFPTSVFLSAVYTEGLFLALGIGALYAARSGRWAWASAAAGLATITRPTGLLLIVPLALLYLYGPRDDRSEPSRAAGWRPRHRLRPDALWLLAIPAALGAYLVYLSQKFGDPFVVLAQGSAWHQTFTLPFVSVWHAAKLAGSGALEVLHGRPPNDVFEFGAFLFACVGTIGALRRLPVAYGAYAAVGIVFIASFPIRGESLSSFSRYMLPLFPILMWLAAWSSERRLFRWVLVAFGLLMMVNAARFATWRFVA